MGKLPLLIWGVLTAGLLLGSAFALWRFFDFRQRSVAAVGEVATVGEVTNPNTRETDRTAWVKWKDSSGADQGFTLYGAYAVGEKIKLRYDPKDPRDVSTASLPWVGIILGLMGLIFFGVFFKMRGALATRPAAASPSP